MRWIPAALGTLRALGAFGAHAGAAGCGGEPELRRCVLTFAGSEDHDEWLLDEEGRPAIVSRWGNDALFERWTFAYDDEGRFVQRRIDSTSQSSGGPEIGPDGIPDELEEVAYTPGAAAVSRTLIFPAGPSRRTALYGFDAAGRTIRYEELGFEAHVRTLQLDDAGRIVSDEVRLPPPTVPAWIRRDYTYDDAGRAITELTTFSDVEGVAFRKDVTYEVRSNGVVARVMDDGTPGAVFAYDLDAAGRVTRASVDLNGDGDDEEVFLLLYLSSELVSLHRTHEGPMDARSYSAGCGVELTAPLAPRPIAPPSAPRLDVPLIPEPFPAIRQ